MKTTVAQFAEAHKVSFSEANGTIKFLEKTGNITRSSKIRTTTAGRSSVVYDIPNKITITFNKPITTAEESAANIKNLKKGIFVKQSVAQDGAAVVTSIITDDQCTEEIEVN